jgi:hypothetical protein
MNSAAFVAQMTLPCPNQIELLETAYKNQYSDSVHRFRLPDLLPLSCNYVANSPGRRRDTRRIFSRWRFSLSLAKCTLMAGVSCLSLAKVRCSSFLARRHSAWECIPVRSCSVVVASIAATVSGSCRSTVPPLGRHFLGPARTVPTTRPLLD